MKLQFSNTFNRSNRDKTDMNKSFIFLPTLVYDFDNKEWFGIWLCFGFILKLNN